MTDGFRLRPCHADGMQPPPQRRSRWRPLGVRLAALLRQDEVETSALVTRPRTLPIVGAAIGRGVAAAGELLARVRFDRAAAWMFRQSLRIDAHDPRAVIGLSRVLVGPARAHRQGFDVDPLLGIVSASSDRRALALAVLEPAVEDDPADPALRREIARLLLSDGSIDGARRHIVAAIDVDPDDAGSHYLAARAVAADADRNGGFTPAQFHAHTRHAERATLLDPGHASARYHLIRVAIRAGDWPTVGRAVASSVDPELAPLVRLFDEHVDVQAIDSSCRLVEQAVAAAPSVPGDWWFAVHWRLLALGRHRAAFAAKRLLAEQVIGRSGPLAHVGSQRFTERMQALVFLERHHEAIHECRRAREQAATSRDRLVLDVLESDVAFALGGHPGPAGMTSRDCSPTRAAEARFADLIRGRRIAVVGPAPAHVDDAEEIASSDVVIKTKVLPGSGGDAPSTISYYAASSSLLLQRQIVRTLHTGEVSMAVFRPAAWPVVDLEPFEDGQLRFSPVEYTMGLAASPFGIQRILHDVLRYEPDEVSVFRSDLFAGEQPYSATYRTDRDVLYAGAGLQPNLDGYGHDLLADFRLTRRLALSGTIKVTTELATILRSTDHEYLARLEHVAHDRMRPTTTDR
jgi:tetratricopeptide (TPR) repeat protein